MKPEDLTLDEIIDFALAEVWMDKANPVKVREKLKAHLKPFLRQVRVVRRGTQ